MFSTIAVLIEQKLMLLDCNHFRLEPVGLGRASRTGKNIIKLNKEVYKMNFNFLLLLFGIAIVIFVLLPLLAPG